MTEREPEAFHEDSPLGDELRSIERVTPTDHLVVRYLDWGRDTRGWSKGTLSSYTSTLVQYRDWLRRTHIFDVTHDEMEAFVLRRRSMRDDRVARVAKPATRAREIATLRSFYEWAWEKNLTPTSMAKGLHSPRVHNMDPRPVPEADWIKAWNAQLTDGERLLLGFGFFCGLRRAELASLRCEQVGPTTLHGFVRKGGGEASLPWREMVAIHEDVMPELMGDMIQPFTLAIERLRHNQPDMPILPWGVTGDASVINDRLRKIQDKAGAEHFTPHQLRHSTATNLLRAGVPLHLVSRLMNHANVTTTMRYVKAGGHELGEWRRRSTSPSG